MMSPWCSGGCAQREDADPFHYYYHTKSAEICGREGPIEGHSEDRHSAAAAWLAEHDLRGADPMALASIRYEIPAGAVTIPVREEGGQG